MNSFTGASAISLPCPITMRCCAVCAISDSRWLDTSTVRPSAASRCMNWRIHRMPSGSKPLTGSSNSSTGGSPNSAPARPSRCDMPSENDPARLPATAVRPTNSSTWSTRAREMPLVAAIQRKCARAERFGCTHLASSKAPTTRSGSSSWAYGTPLIKARPEVGRSSPRIIRIVVDLPAPFGPRNPVTWPGRTVNVRFCTAGVEPKCLVSPCTSIMPTSLPDNLPRRHHSPVATHLIPKDDAPLFDVSADRPGSVRFGPGGC